MDLSSVRQRRPEDGAFHRNRAGPMEKKKARMQEGIRAWVLPRCSRPGLCKPGPAGHYLNVMWTTFVSAILPEEWQRKHCSVLVSAVARGS